MAGKANQLVRLPISPEEAIELAYEDQLFFGEYFFPKSCRQAPAPAHKLMWEDLMSPQVFVSFMIFRGSAKTTIVRIYLAFLISYGIARTILVVGKSESAAARTLEWLMRAVSFNTLWSQSFGITAGDKWNSTEIEVRNEQLGVSTRVLAMGIGGSTRGVNVDDYRPDIIVVDDPCDEENTASKEQREKINEAFFGALQNSLAPTSEAPMSKMVLMQTVLNSDDLVSLTSRDPQWTCRQISIYTPTGDSAWPARWTRAELDQMKQGFIDRGMLHVWMREMECQVISSATAAFVVENLQYWTVYPETGRTIISVDPTPPARDGSKEKYTGNLDDAVVRALRLHKGKVYVIAWYATKTPDPFELIEKIFEMATTHQAKEIAVETVLFARVLATLLEKEMVKRHQWFMIHKEEDKRKKDTRIRQEVGAFLGTRSLYVHKSDRDLISQITMYPAVNHDDHIDCVAIGLKVLNRINFAQELVDDPIEGEFEALPDDWMAAP